MSDWLEFSAKTVDEALTEALISFETTSDKIEYEVIEKEKSGVLGMFSKKAIIKVRKRENPMETVQSFLNKVFGAMNLEVNLEMEYNDVDDVISVELSGSEMGLLIGKRGQTLDSIQYLTSLVLNKSTDKYIKVKVDTENYRSRREETIEGLARNVASKVKKTRKPSYLEAMNPYERRIIHSYLQSDKMVETHSEGEEPNRKVVIEPSKELMNSPIRDKYNGNSNYKGNSRYKGNSNYAKKQ